MSVWVTIPSARPPEEIEVWAKAWRERGYKIALYRDDVPLASADLLLLITSYYPGYANAVNALVAYAMEADKQAEWFIAAGDDIFPDPNKSAEEIARECREHFAFEAMTPCQRADGPAGCETFGVMQPTGDRWQEGQGGFTNAPIDRVAGSAWIGREFARRMYGGRGPLYHEYRHMFVDEELQLVAEKYGVFWQRRDLTHLHQHWARGKGLHDLVDASRMPAFLAEANSGEHWKKYKGIFEARKASGFPGSEPL